MSGLSAGSLDRRVTILRVIGQTIGRMNEATPIWGEVAEVWASVGPWKSRERWVAQEEQVAAVATHRVVVRWGLNVTPLDRLRFEGRVFEIITADEIGRRVGQLIAAVARAE